MLDQELESKRSLGDVVEALCESHDSLSWAREDWTDPRRLPSRDRLVNIIDTLRSVLFPGYYGDPDLSRDSLMYRIGTTLDTVMQLLKDEITRGICFATCKNPTTCKIKDACGICEVKALRITQTFLGKLPEIKRLLATDVMAAYEGDPALVSPDEAIFCYPGILAVTNYRLAHELHVLGVPLIPRIVTEHAHSLTGIDIHPGATIGESFFIDHGTGVVIGETCVIGDRVRIYQGVTLGAKSFPMDKNGNPIKGIPRHPIVEDDVIIYSGATILGRITLGRGAVIGGNTWVTRDVEPGGSVNQGPRQ